MMYEIYLDNALVGHAEIVRKGLYYQVVCSCRPPDIGTYRVVAYSDTAEVDLGICVPDGSCYHIVKQIPSKYFGTGKLRFMLIGHVCENVEFISIDAHAPFPKLDQLPFARFLIRDGSAGILI